MFDSQIHFSLRHPKPKPKPKPKPEKYTLPHSLLMSAFACITCTCVSLIIMFAVVGIPIIVYYAQNPKNPTFTLEHASVNGFNLTSDGHLTSFFDIGIKANNPNHKMKLVYSGVRVSIFKDKQNLAEDVLDDFAQRKRDVRLLKVEPVSLNVSLDNGLKFNLGLESGMGYIIFDVFMTAGLNGDNLEVNCDHITVNITNSATSIAASSPSYGSNDAKGNFSSIDCSVYIYSNDDA